MTNAPDADWKKRSMNASRCLFTCSGEKESMVDMYTSCLIVSTADLWDRSILMMNGTLPSNDRVGR
jgi:hypothetical protein